jgi:hypothetical protein
MTWAAIGATAVKAAAGESQLGAPAPAFQPGTSGFDALQLGGDSPFGDQGAVQQLGNGGISGLFGGDFLESLIGPQESRDQTLAPQVTAQDAGPLGTTQAFENPTDPNLLESLQQPQEKSGFGAFFGNLDQNLQSPSKLLGLSLLSQIDPRLAQGGLAAGGLFGQNKVF